MRPVSLSLTILTLACSPQGFTSDTSKGTAAPEAASSPSPAASQGNPNMETAESIDSNTMEADRVSAPVNVTGSYLQCESTLDAQHAIVCKVIGDAKSVEPRKAYVRPANGSAWIEVTFIKEALGSYRINVPADINADFALSLSYGSSLENVVVDWVGSHSSAVNLIGDPSFENTVLDSSESYRVLTSETSPSWKVMKSDTSNCAGEAVLEIQKDGDIAKQRSFDGRNRLELDSSCRINNQLAGGENIVAYQDLNSTIGKEYLLRFAVAHRLEVTTEPSRLRVRFGDEIIWDGSVSDAKWQEMRFRMKATSNVTRISFEERGTEDLGGALIDAVSVIEIPSL